MMNVAKCSACKHSMEGIQAVCACSFLCDCNGGGTKFTPVRSLLKGSVVVSGQRWCSECAPTTEEDEPTLVEGVVVDDFDLSESTSPGATGVGSPVENEAAKEWELSLMEHLFQRPRRE